MESPLLKAGVELALQKQEKQEPKSESKVKTEEDQKPDISPVSLTVSRYIF